MSLIKHTLSVFTILLLALLMVGCTTNISSKSCPENSVPWLDKDGNIVACLGEE